MIITSLSLSDFRNHAKAKFEFSPGVTLIIGPNTAGKTNLLEAIFMLSVGKSFKAEGDREMIAFGKELARIKAIVEQFQKKGENGSDIGDAVELEIMLSLGQVMNINTPMKKHSINGVAKRIIDFIGRLKVVFFWPEDLELIIGGPSLRRRYMDFVLLQADREYRRCLISYEKAVRQRNRLLEAIRDKGVNRSQLVFWDQLIIKDGQYISRKREEYIGFLNQTKNLETNLPAGRQGTQNLKYILEYDKSEVSRARLDQYANEEVAAGITLVGPHRDDIIFNIKDQKSNIKNDEIKSKNLAHFGSRGEQRLGILWLKLGEIAYIEKETREKPVLLLDDILSELDHEHRKIIFDVINNQQTIMTTTDMHFIEKEMMKKCKMIVLG